MHALGLEFGSAAQLSKRPGSVWNCLWGNALKRSPGIIRKSGVSYPGLGFLSSATWPSLPKKHCNGLNQTLALLYATRYTIDQIIMTAHQCGVQSDDFCWCRYNLSVSVTLPRVSFYKQRLVLAIYHDPSI